MRTSIIAILLAGIGSVPLIGPAAAVPAGPSPSLATASEALIPVRMRRHRMRKGRMGMRPGASGMRTTTPGAPGGGSGTNAVTGSGAAPSGK